MMAGQKQSFVSQSRKKWHHGIFFIYNQYNHAFLLYVLILSSGVFSTTTVDQQLKLNINITFKFIFETPICDICVLLTFVRFCAQTVQSIPTFNGVQVLYHTLLFIIRVATVNSTFSYDITAHGGNWFHGLRTTTRKLI